MHPAFDDAGRGHEGNFGILFQVRKVEGPAAAHGRNDFPNGDVQIVFQFTRVRNITVDPFFKFEAFIATHVVTLPVAGPVGTFAPVFFHIAVAYFHLLGWTFIEAGEVSSHHDEIGSHGQCQHHVVILHDTAI